MICSECGIGTILEDYHGAEVAMVCDSCGAMSNQTQCSLQYTDNPNFEYTSLEKKYKSNAGDIKIKGVAFRQSLNELKSCIEKFANNSEAVKKIAVDLYTNMSVEGLHHKKPKKQLAAACAYLALKQSNIPISIHCVSESMGITSRKLNRIIFEIKQLSGGIRMTTVEAEVKMSIESLPFMKEDEHLIPTAMGLFSLFHHFSMVDGKCPTTIAAACSYFAVISKEKTKRCTSANSFCLKNNFPLGSTQQYISLTKARILSLIERIPWIDPSEPKRPFHTYISDVVRFKDSLLRSFIENESESRVKKLLSPPGLFVPMRHDDKGSASLPEVSTSEVLCEEDLPESEFTMYLRSSEEVSKLQIIQDLIKFDVGGKVE